MLGFRFATWHCVSPNPQRRATFFFFTTFVILAGMVVLSLFIGVITIGMLTEYTKYTGEKDVSNYNEGISIATQAFVNPESILRLAVDFAMGIENPNVAKKFLIRKTHDGIVFERRSARDGKYQESGFPSHSTYDKNKPKRSFNSSKSFDSGLRLSLDSGLQSPNGIQSPEACNETLPLPAEYESIWSFARPAIPTKVNTVKTKKSRRSSFFAKADAQALLRQAVIISVNDLSTFGRIVDAVKKMSQKLVDSQIFQNIITIAVIIAAITVGVETDKRGDPKMNKAIDFGCLLAFTFECFVKVFACGEVGHPCALLFSFHNLNHASSFV